MHDEEMFSGRSSGSSQVPHQNTVLFCDGLRLNSTRARECLVRAILDIMQHNVDFEDDAWTDTMLTSLQTTPAPPMGSPVNLPIVEPSQDLQASQSSQRPQGYAPFWSSNDMARFLQQPFPQHQLTDGYALLWRAYPDLAELLGTPRPLKSPQPPHSSQLSILGPNATSMVELALGRPRSCSSSDKGGVILSGALYSFKIALAILDMSLERKTPTKEVLRIFTTTIRVHSCEKKGFRVYSNHNKLASISKIPAKPPKAGRITAAAPTEELDEAEEEDEESEDPVATDPPVEEDAEFLLPDELEDPLNEAEAEVIDPEGEEGTVALTIPPTNPDVGDALVIPDIDPVMELPLDICILDATRLDQPNGELIAIA
ncbi:hypothetical protein E4T42_09412 [Aureobasidium subglaciale]|nr:hypothetical protein E4T42_09412 [Aureobasidium subglaciale]